MAPGTGLDDVLPTSGIISRLSLEPQGSLTRAWYEVLIIALASPWHLLMLCVEGESESAIRF